MLDYLQNKKDGRRYFETVIRVQQKLVAFVSDFITTYDLTNDDTLISTNTLIMKHIVHSSSSLSLCCRKNL